MRASARLRTALLLAAGSAALVGRAASASDPPGTLAEYQLALMKAGPEERKFLDERRLQAMQEERLLWLATLHAEGKAIVSGPVWQGGDLRGVVVLRAASKAEAEEILRGDPFVRAGRSAPEIHPWWCDQTAFRKTADVGRLARTWLVLLRRPASAPSYDEKRLQEIQTGHMANIRKMAASGDLVAAGPFGDDGTLRGIFVFGTADRERVRALVAEDPAIKAGRLEAEILSWSIPEGEF